MKNDSDYYLNPGLDSRASAAQKPTIKTCLNTLDKRTIFVSGLDFQLIFQIVKGRFPCCLHATDTHLLQSPEQNLYLEPGDGDRHIEQDV